MASCAQHHESGIIVQYANQNTEEQLRELEYLDAQFTLRRTSSGSTDPPGSPDHVVLAGAPPAVIFSPTQPRRTISDGIPMTGDAGDIHISTAAAHHLCGQPRRMRDVQWSAKRPRPTVEAV
jgi:hypothetical protein